MIGKQLKALGWGVLIAVTGQQAHGQDLTLWYTKPAVEWTEALPIGNGKLGGMVFGGVEEDRIQFNEESLWTGRPRDYNQKGAVQYLDQIRKLIFEGKQAEAEKLAMDHFMGLKSVSDDPQPWFKKMRAITEQPSNPAQIDFDDSQWKTLTVPVYDGWEREGLEGLDGSLWFRISFDVPQSWLGKDLVLDLGKIRDQDFTYVNGKLVGTMVGINEKRQYTILKELVKTHNQIAVQVLNYDDKGGIVGYKGNQRKLQVFPKGEGEAQAVLLGTEWKYWIQDDEVPRVGKFQEAYQPFGDVKLQFEVKQPITDYKRSLDLSQALSTTSYRSGQVRYERTYFASAVDHCLAVRVKADQKGMVSFKTLLSSPHKNYVLTSVNDSTLKLNVQVKHGALRGVAMLKVRHQGGQLSLQDGALNVQGADEATLLWTAATNFKNYQDVSGNPDAICEEQTEQLSHRAIQQIQQEHIQDYQRYFNRFSVHFGAPTVSSLPTDERIARFSKAQDDPNLLSLFMQYGRYLLISSSRPGSLPPNLQGIWNELLTPPWGSKYTTNINAEMNYWLAEPTNLSDLQEPFFHMISELSVNGQETAKEYYGAPGWVLHHNTDLWKATAPINASNHGIWVTGGAWLCQHLWEHYLYTKDINFLKEEAYPIMKASAQFFDHFLIPDPKTGWLISVPSNSPEHGGLVAGPTMDHQIIRQLFKNVVAAAEVLNVDADFAANIAGKTKKIAPNQIGKYGQLQEWLTDLDDPKDTHRHVSHMWAVYPGNEINWQQTPKLVNAAKKSMAFRGDAGTGWSLAWKINLWARFRDGDHAYKMVNMLLSPAGQGGGVYPNLFDAHPPFQIDGNFGGTSGIAEMLLQSHLDAIDVLPALPTALKDGEVKGICARGGFELAYQWKDGKLVHLELWSKAGAPCHLRYGGKERAFKTEKGKHYVLDGDLVLTGTKKS